MVRGGSFRFKASFAVLFLAIIQKGSQATKESTICKNGLPFLIHGDWGTTGENQTKIAEQMNEWSLDNQAKFLIALGDNFYYDGVVSTTDPQWNSTYRNVYTQPGLQIPWYVVLGNHDYHTNPEAQIEYFKQNIDDRWILPDYLYSRRYPISNDVDKETTYETNCGLSGTETCYLEIVFINTPTLSPLETAQTRPTGAYAVTEEMIEEYLLALEVIFQASEAKWLIVAGHYTIYSMADHGDNPELIARLVPLLEKYGVQLYLNGHDHVLQHISWQGVEYVTSGHGTYTNHFPDAMFNYERGSIARAGVKFTSLRPGFSTACVAEKDGLTLHMVDVDGQDLYEVTLTNPRLTANLQRIRQSTSTSTLEHQQTLFDLFVSLWEETNQSILLFALCIFVIGLCFGLACISVGAIVISLCCFQQKKRRSTLLNEMKIANEQDITRRKTSPLSKLMSKLAMSSWHTAPKASTFSADASNHGNNGSISRSIELNHHHNQQVNHRLLSHSNSNDDHDDLGRDIETNRNPLSTASDEDELEDEFIATSKFVQGLKMEQRSSRQKLQQAYVPAHVQQKYHQMRQERKMKELQAKIKKKETAESSLSNPV